MKLFCWWWSFWSSLDKQSFCYYCLFPAAEVWWTKLLCYTFALLLCCICVMPRDPSFMMDLMMHGGI